MIKCFCLHFSGKPVLPLTSWSSWEPQCNLLLLLLPCSLAHPATAPWLGSATWVTILFPFPCTDFPKPLQTPIMLWVAPPHPADTGPMSEFGCVLGSFGFCEDFCEGAPVWTLKDKNQSWLGKWIARRVAWLGKDRQVLNVLTLGSEAPLNPCGSFH